MATQAIDAPAPEESARDAGLRYTSDVRPGISRLRRGKGFTYLDAEGKKVEDPATLARIRALAVPPAWIDVWICSDPQGHLQATGRDARGRKQYRYHDRWREVRDANKFERLAAFGQGLPKIRRRVERDLAKPGLPRERILAAVIRLLEITLIRVGNEAYARENRSYGLTTLLDRHADVNGSAVEFRFRGKGGKLHRAKVRDGRLAAIVKRSQGLPGEQLFQYIDEEGNVQDIDSADVNDYLREITGQDFTAKDFRTWAATVAAMTALQAVAPISSEREARRKLLQAIDQVAEQLGNTPAVCRKCYIHPAIIAAFEEGSLSDALAAHARSQAKRPSRLRSEEAAMLAVLKAHRSKERRRGAA